jgi:hypothetical protein
MQTVQLGAQYVRKNCTIALAEVRLKTATMHKLTVKKLCVSIYDKYRPKLQYTET